MVTSRIWFTQRRSRAVGAMEERAKCCGHLAALERKNKTGVERIVVLDRGIVPAPRRRALAALRLEEREEISRGIAVGRSIRQIAQSLARAPSTVSREIRRDGGSQAYRANRADPRAWERRCAPSLAVSRCIGATIARRAEARAAMVAAADLPLAEAGVPNPPRHADISRSDLSQPLHPDPRRAEEGADRAVAYCAADASPQEPQREECTGHILDMASIRERPAEIEDRAVPGHWEGDLLTGANDTHIATLVERNTRFTMLVKVPRKDTTTVVAALAKHIRKLPEELRRSLTCDQGKEMHAHKRFTLPPTSRSTS